MDKKHELHNLRFAPFPPYPEKGLVIMATVKEKHLEYDVIVSRAFFEAMDKKFPIVASTLELWVHSEARTFRFLVLEKEREDFTKDFKKTFNAKELKLI